MHRKYGHIGMVLRFNGNKDIDRSALINAYKNGDIEMIKEVEKEFRDYSRKKLDALFQSLYRHSLTKLGKGWDVSIYAVASAYRSTVGVEKDISVLRMLLVNNPERLQKLIKSFQRKVPRNLHIHLLMSGSPASTIADWIDSYWRKRWLGTPGRMKFDEDQINSYLLPYIKGQALIYRSLKINT